jgi:Family of unknown function (DUF6165)
VTKKQEVFKGIFLLDLKAFLFESLWQFKVNEMNIFVEIGAGELIDKITILEIKLARIKDEDKLKNIRFEIETISPFAPDLPELKAKLKLINETLWEIEDDIRIHEREKNFGERFIALARAVYVTNDKRAEVKREINLAANSSLVEEKSYEKF